MRIQVVGTTGAGKTRFADRLSSLTGHPRIIIDDLQFKPGWVKLPDSQFDKLLAEAIKGPNWIACGTYFSSSAKTYEKADYIVWLQYPLWKILWRVTLRTLKRIWTKERVCNGNVETIRGQFFSTKSIYVYVLKSYKKRTRKQQMSQDPQQAHKWITVKNKSEAEKAITFFEERILKKQQ